MALTENVSFPDESATYVPLGGDGFSAPFAMYIVDRSVTGDASGGAVTQSFTMDERYCSLVRWIGMSIGQTNADTQYRLNIAANPEGTSPKLGITGTLVGVASTVSSEGAQGFWVPPQTVLPPAAVINTQFTNVLSDTFRISMEVLLWNIRVRELSPWQYLMNAAGGGGQVGPGI